MMKHKQVKSNGKKPKSKQIVNILGVDDEMICRFVLGDILKDVSNNYKVVESGQQAIDEVISGNIEYHLVITDLNMPNISGYDLAIRLREYAINNNKKILIYAQSASERGIIEGKCKEAGFDGVVIKPINAAVIKAIIQENFK